MHQKKQLLANPRLQIAVRPDLGGRIDSFIDQGSGKEWVWHPPGYDANGSRTLSRGSSFDDNWTGGWDEVFPNDSAGVFQGRSLHDHGELWSQSWELQEYSPLGISMTLECESMPLTIGKTLVLDPRQPELQIRYVIRNRSPQPQPFLFKLHPAIAIEEGDQLLMPECELEPVALEFSRIADFAARTPFPFVRGAEGGRLRIDAMHSKDSGLREFLYAGGLREGWCGVHSVATGTRLMFSFETRHFPFVWIFSSFSGFRDHYVLILEPCTNKPFDLETALQQRTCAVIPPHGSLEYGAVISVQD